MASRFVRQGRVQATFEVVGLSAGEEAMMLADLAQERLEGESCPLGALGVRRVEVGGSHLEVTALLRRIAELEGVQGELEGVQGGFEEALARVEGRLRACERAAGAVVEGLVVAQEELREAVDNVGWDGEDDAKRCKELTEAFWDERAQGDATQVSLTLDAQP